eukprot:TRINITY_DN7573_c0_g3_i2.p2 TRINITY_DN7573_c0_g3~~TRINITY_DN7573_c0_g3_i2.p2  ORF type:complete len:104 (-),score=6.16 TRINITY_DN7573_c0_g3_i2:564-875(-)
MSSNLTPSLVDKHVCSPKQKHICVDQAEACTDVALRSAGGFADGCLLLLAGLLIFPLNGLDGIRRPVPGRELPGRDDFGLMGRLMTGLGLGAERARSASAWDV